MLVVALGFAAIPSSRAAAPGAQLPAGCFGVVASEVLLDGQVDLNLQLAAIRATGTQSIRFPIYWSTAQPYASWAEVPRASRSLFASVAGRPTSFAQIDEQMLAFARHGLRMLPVVLQAPPWARVDPARPWSPPSNPKDYGRFVGALVRRYGTHGQFWAERPRLAGLAPQWWQIWNEPAGGQTPDGPTLFWDGPEPYEPRYVAMLRASRRAARRADPRARILLAGLFGDSWDALAQIYRYGGRGLFDGVAVHPYADTPAHVLAGSRDCSRGARDRHDPGRSGVEPRGRVPAPRRAPSWTEPRGHLLVHVDRAEPSSDEFQYSGLLRLTPAGQIQVKPAFRAYDRTLRRLERSGKRQSR